MNCEVWVGLIGVLLGGLMTLGGILLTHFLSGQKQSKLDKARKELLKKVLLNAKGQGWMRVQTLAGIVGCSLEDVRGLLIEINARGSAKPEKEMWSLISRNPLPDGDNNDNQ